MSICHAIKGSQPEDATPNGITMVGAETGPQNGLSFNDIALLRFTLCALDNLRIPIPEKLQPFLDNTSNELVAPVEIINKSENHGGKDFQTESTTNDIVIICNVPRHDHGCTAEAVKHIPGLNESFQIAHNNTLEAWRKKITETTPSIMLIYGADGYTPEELQTDNYILIKGSPILGQGILISREYIENAEAYFMDQNSILATYASSNNSAFHLEVHAA